MEMAQEGSESALEIPLDQDDFELRRVLRWLPVAAYTCDAEGQITAYNNRAASLWGRSPKLRDPEDRFCGALRLFKPDGSPVSHDRCWMAMALRTGQTYEGHEAICERPDGSRRIATVHAHPFHDQQGKVTGALNVLLDVTEQKQKQEQHCGNSNLPIAVAESIPEESTQDVCSPPPVLPQRILVVDDEVVVARSIACLLEAMGHHVCEAYDGEEVSEAMLDFRPDVVLCDIAMTKFNGYEFARHIRSQSWGRDVPLIACSGNGVREHVEKSLEAGFDHHLVKPLKLDALMSVLEKFQLELA